MNKSLRNKLSVLVIVIVMLSGSLYGQLCNQTMNVGAHTTTYTSTMVRGYYFTAPISFTICELYVPDNLNTQMQHVEVVRFTAGPPPAWSATTNNFVSLFNQTQWVPNTPIPCSITVNAGDIIGIYGARGNTATMYNSYSSSSFAATIDGNPVTLRRSGMQFTLNGSFMHDIWSEVNYSIGRIIMGYDPILLPVDFTSFTGQKDGNINVLDWATASEQNCDYYEVERSVDGENFESIGQVNGSGNSSNEIKYQFRDKEPTRGINYYRLRQVDYNGNYEYSTIVAIDNTMRSGFSIYPNPVEAFIVVSFEEQPEAPCLIEIKSMTGKSVLFTEVSNASNYIELNEMEPGMYILETTMNGNTVSEKFIKK